MLANCDAVTLFVHTVDRPTIDMAAVQPGIVSGNYTLPAMFGRRSCIRHLCSVAKVLRFSTKTMFEVRCAQVWW